MLQSVLSIINLILIYDNKPYKFESPSACVKRNPNRGTRQERFTEEFMISTSLLDLLLKPDRVVSRSEALSHPSPIPRVAGIYAWYFRGLPPFLDVTGCVTFHDMTLLYLGISPSSPASSRNLYERIRSHYSNNASASTLRLSLGCLLSERLAIQLRRVGRTERYTFSDGEKTLNEWMGMNAFVTWMPIDSPWLYEEDLIHRLKLPLNLDGNTSNPNHGWVSSARRQAKAVANQLPVLPR